MMSGKVPIPPERDPQAGISLNPKEFVAPDVIELPADEVIRLLYRQESHRSRDGGEESQRDVPIAFRCIPDGLSACLKGISIATGFDKSVITKCLSHHVKAWYDNMAEVKALVQLYNKVYLKSDGYPDVARRLEDVNHELTSAVGVPDGHGVTHLRSIGFVRGYLSDLAPVLGTTGARLFLVGLCWSISTNTAGWFERNMAQYFQPEVTRLRRHIGERALFLDYLSRLLAFREGHK